MDFLLTKQSTPKTFIRYSIKGGVDTKSRSQTLSQNRSGFYYIGKDSQNIEKLVNVFKRGYASEHIENAKSELIRSLTQEKNSIPEVIFCESRFDLAAIKGFSNFLSSHELFSSIPFVIDTTHLPESKLSYFRKNKLADDIVYLQQYDDKVIHDKIQFLKKIKSAPVNNESIGYTEALSFANIHSSHLLKRSVDIILSLTAIFLLSPVFLLIGLAIRFESKGSIFYISKRAGKGYKIFDFFKFRTMRSGSDKNIDEYSHLNQYNATDDGPVFFKINNDPRITRVGCFLRNHSLDELPQLINVLIGDMSLVGNRPLPLYEAATLTTDEYAKRFLAPAGITGLWQIKKRGKENMSVQERINLDIDYADKNNFVYDLWIMANTPSALVQKESV